MWVRCSLIAFVGLLPVASPSYSAEPKSKIAIETDIVYSKIGDKEMKFDLAKPTEGKGPFPVVVTLHGGGWRMGNKRDNRSWIQFLAENGYVAVSVAYRLPPPPPLPPAE